MKAETFSGRALTQFIFHFILCHRLVYLRNQNGYLQLCTEPTVKAETLIILATHLQSLTHLHTRKQTHLIQIICTLPQKWM